ncbi:hypothetical protein [Halobacillus sp. H74]
MSFTYRLILMVNIANLLCPRIPTASINRQVIREKQQQNLTAPLD